MIKYPYLPRSRQIEYVRPSNAFMMKAKEEASTHSLDDNVKTGAVVVSGNMVIGLGANGSEYHSRHGCRRVELHIPTGQGYELCEGCHPKNHAEVSAINDAIAEDNRDKLKDASIYLWGHWWCCKYCWDSMIEAGIKHVYLMEGSETVFNREILT